jgi:hypothetical protein
MHLCMTCLFFLCVDLMCVGVNFYRFSRFSGLTTRTASGQVRCLCFRCSLVVLWRNYRQQFVSCPCMSVRGQTECQPIDPPAPTHQYINTAIHQHSHQHVNTIHQHINTSTHQHYDVPKHLPKVAKLSDLLIL